MAGYRQDGKGDGKGYQVMITDVKWITDGLNLQQVTLLPSLSDNYRNLFKRK